MNIGSYKTQLISFIEFWQGKRDKWEEKADSYFTIWRSLVTFRACSSEGMRLITYLQSIHLTDCEKIRFDPIRSKLNLAQWFCSTCWKDAKREFILFIPHSCNHLTAIVVVGFVSIGGLFKLYFTTGYSRKGLSLSLVSTDWMTRRIMV